MKQIKLVYKHHNYNLKELFTQNITCIIINSQIGLFTQNITCIIINSQIGLFTQNITGIIINSQIGLLTQNITRIWWDFYMKYPKHR